MIRPGDNLDLQPAGEAIRIAKRRATASPSPLPLKDRLHLFDQATARQRRRQSVSGKKQEQPSFQKRGWTREELYHRGLPR